LVTGADVDDCEKAAQEYILHLGYKEEEVPFEPAGQEGPDFVIKKRIAVEVTRLNRHVGVSAEGKRLGEEDADRVLEAVKQILQSLGPPTAGLSWFVSVECTLPAPRNRKVRREVCKHLKAFQNGSLQKPTRIKLFDNFAIELCRAGQIGSHYFLMGGLNHNDSGELVSEEMERSLKICIDAKARKLSYLRSKDLECWLALVDLVSYGYWGARDRVRIPPHGWDKIILINPRDAKQSFELA
jgi:hypothetical protein